MFSNERVLLIAAIVFPLLCLIAIVLSLVMMIAKIRQNRRAPSQKLREQIFVFRTILIVFGAILIFCLAAYAVLGLMYACLYDAAMHHM